MVKHTVQGTFGSISKILSSLSTGITVVSRDRRYLLERQKDKIRHHPRDLVDGIGVGLKAFLKGLRRGVSGVVMEPIRGYR